MERFVTRHGDRLVGILSGFDRMLFRGTLRSISYVDGGCDWSAATANVSICTSYFVDPDFGLMHVGLQTRLPLTIQVCVNGRAWLARQLAREGVAVTQVDTCFTTIADGPRAQTI